MTTEPTYDWRETAKRSGDRRIDVLTAFWNSVLHAHFCDARVQLHQVDMAGHLKGDVDEFLARLAKEWDLSLLWNRTEPRRAEHRYVAMTRTDAAVFVESTSRTDVQALFTDREQATKFTAWLLTHLDEALPERSVFALARANSELALMRLGALEPTPFEPRNYEPTIGAAFQYACSELRSATPNGRLLILEGERGTGKSHFIRGLVNDVAGPQFVVVPPHLVAELANPEFVPLLVKQSSEHPIVLILEDADACLVVRGSDNMSAISALLNTTDGLFGELLNLRVVASTNAKRIQMDEAVVRDGRLSQHLLFQSLPVAQAHNVLARLLGDGPFLRVWDGNRVPLGTVYKKARELGWKPPPVTRRRPTVDDDFIARLGNLRVEFDR